MPKYCLKIAVFGSQPPMHLTAPSPIHASQLQPPPSPNTLQVTGQVQNLTLFLILDFVAFGNLQDQ